jgi:phenylalanyl-tRNA synthetase beta chain
MIFTRSWLAEFIDISTVSDTKIVDTLNAIGFEVEGHKKYEIPKGIVVGKVLECAKHPDADKLSVCQVDTGKAVHSIVCGASNVAKDQLVAVATIGAKLDSGLVIKQAELRGVQSFGMLCSSSELGLVKTNDGILVLDSSIDGLKIGQELNSLPQIADSIFEIDITPNRSDCLSVHGVARELGAFFGLKLRDFVACEIKENDKGIGRIVAMHSKNKSESNIAFKIAQRSEEILNAPLLVEYRLSLISSKASMYSDKLVEYAMHATGVVLTLFSEDSFYKNEEKIEIFIDKNSDNLDVVKGNSEIFCIGISQTPESKPKPSDTLMILSASYTEPSRLQTISEQIKIKDERIWSKSLKGSETNLLLGLNYFAELSSRYCGIMFYAGITEDIKQVEKTPMKVDINKINTIIGEQLDKNFVVNLLRKLGFEMTVNAEFDNCIVKAPDFRHDITNVHDLAEEILRIKGIDSLVAKPLVMVEAKRLNDYSESYYYLRDIRKKSVSQGFFEAIHFIFTNKKDEDFFALAKLKESLDVTNPITAELDTLRSTLLINLLSSASKNFKNGAKCVPLFECGTVFDKNRVESQKGAFVWCGKSEKESISNQGKPADIDFVAFVSKIVNIFGGLEVVQKSAKGDLYHPHRYAILQKNGETVGFVSALHKKALDYFDLPSGMICEIDIDKVSEDKKSAQEFSRYQKSERDLTLVIPDDMRFDFISKCVDELSNPLIKAFYAIDSFKADEKDSQKALTVRFALQSDEKTLTEDDINSVITLALEKFKTELNIGLKQ